jgi:hypothetical protein
MTMLKEIPTDSGIPRKKTRASVTFLQNTPYNGITNTLKGLNKMPFESGTKQRLEKLLETLSSDEKSLFSRDLLDGIFEFYLTNSDKKLKEIIESWDATSEFYLEPGLLDKIKKTENEIENGDYVIWTPDTL